MMLAHHRITCRNKPSITCGWRQSNCIEQMWEARPTSHRIEIIQPGPRQEHSVAAKMDALGFEQAPLAGALGERPVRADDAMPGRVARVRMTQDVARETRSAWRHVAVGAHVASWDRTHPPQDGSVVVVVRAARHRRDRARAAGLPGLRGSNPFLRARHNDPSARSAASPPAYAGARSRGHGRLHERPPAAVA
jgi:hypothetical protein